jgi:hypothetical protein
VIEGDLPEGMRARCAWCQQIKDASGGAFVEIKPSTGATRLFRCSDCSENESAAA